MNSSGEMSDMSIGDDVPGGFECSEQTKEADKNAENEVRGQEEEERGEEEDNEFYEGNIRIVPLNDDENENEPLAALADTKPDIKLYGLPHDSKRHHIGQHCRESNDMITVHVIRYDAESAYLFEKTYPKSELKDRDGKIVKCDFCPFESVGLKLLAKHVKIKHPNPSAIPYKP